MRPCNCIGAILPPRRVRTRLLSSEELPRGGGGGCVHPHPLPTPKPRTGSDREGAHRCRLLVALAVSADCPARTMADVLPKVQNDLATYLAILLCRTRIPIAG